jgi:hypothetical protein
VGPARGRYSAHSIQQRLEITELIREMSEAASYWCNITPLAHG